MMLQVVVPAVIALDFPVDVLLGTCGDSRPPGPHSDVTVGMERDDCYKG